MYVCPDGSLAVLGPDGSLAVLGLDGTFPVVLVWLLEPLKKQKNDSICRFATLTATIQ